MPDLHHEAEKQLGCLDARIAQLRDEYEQIQFAEMVARRAGSRLHAEHCRVQSHKLIGTLSYLVSQRSRTEH
ncbi:MAG TPA: hypothetical protein VKA94_12715 [Hyphomicrobiales bacterium]|nr:hypothetical protein [Hyphomicrobiales bacterium]